MHRPSALRVGDLGIRRREERDLDVIGLPSPRLQRGENQLMADRTAAGGDLLAAQIVETLDRRLFRHQDREPVPRLPDGGDRLHRHVGGSGEGEWRISDQPGLDRAGAERLQKRRCGRKFLPLDLVGNVLERRRPLPSRPANCPSGRRSEAWFAHGQERRSRATARRQVRDGSLRGHPVGRLAFGDEFSRQRMSSRPYSMASISGSKPRIRKWLMPRS